jgi:hypothetical protein
MGNDWILDVLADLRRFAQLNDLPFWQSNWMKQQSSRTPNYPYCKRAHR